jgi:hypothetical protein
LSVAPHAIGVLFFFVSIPFSGTQCDREAYFFSLQPASLQVLVITGDANVSRDKYFFEIWVATIVASALQTAILKFRVNQSADSLCVKTEKISQAM